MYKLSFYVPETHLTMVKNALFAAGAGKIGDYAECCWQVLGAGQFRPLANSHPTIGEPQQLTTVAEYLVEMVCQDKLIHTVINVLKNVHPYEMPAFSAIKIDIDE